MMLQATPQKREKRMDIFILCLFGAWFFLLGTAMGSFYNVLIDRLPNDQDVIKSRSECTSCHTKLTWRDLIPVWSFVFLKGRCRYCGQKLSYQYLFSELAVGGLFLLAFLLQGRWGNWLMTAILLTLWSMLFVVGVMDYKYGVIIDQVLIAFTVIGIVLQLIAKVSILDILLGGAVGFALYGLIYLVARLVYKKEAFGMGDVLLLAAIGTFFGPWKTLMIGFLAIYCAIFFIIFLWIKNKKLGRGIEMPLAPAICTAAFIASLAGEQIMDFLRKLIFR